MSVEAVLAAMLTLPEYTGDKGQTPESRRQLYAPVATMIHDVSHSRSEEALLVALAEHESGFARFVVEGRCSEGPPGQRCDGGNARGVFQLHAAACPSAWQHPEGSPESMALEAACAIRLLRWGGSQCQAHALTPIHGALGVYAGRGCEWAGAEKRVVTMTRLLAKWGKN